MYDVSNCNIVNSVTKCQGNVEKFHSDTEFTDWKTVTLHVECV